MYHKDEFEYTQKVHFIWGMIAGIPIGIVALMLFSLLFVE